MENHKTKQNLSFSGNQIKLQNIIPKVEFLTERCQFQTNEHLPVQVKKQSLQGISFKINSYIMAYFQIQSKIFYAFAQKAGDAEESFSNIYFYEFKKENGQHKKVQLNKIKGYVSVLRIDLIYNFNFAQLQLQKQNRKQKKPSIYTFVILLGTKQGYLKRINLENQKIQSKKLANAPVVDILTYKSKSAKINNFYFILIENTNIFLVNIHNFDTLIKFHFNIMKQVDKALCLRLDWSQSFLLQSTKGGYIVLWELHHQKIQEACKKSEDNKFLAKNIILDVFPKFKSHSIVRDGLIFIDFFANLLFLITLEYKLKIISIDIKKHENFVVLLQFSLPSAPKQMIQYQRYHCFKLMANKFCLYYSIQSSKHSIYKVQLNDFMQVQQIIKYKMKGLKNVDQFSINQSQQYFTARQDDKFVIKYLQKSKDKKQDKMQFQY